MKVTKKAIALISTIAMAAQFGFVIPASAEEVNIDIINSGYLVTVSEDNNSVSIPVTNNTAKDSVVSAYVATYNGTALNGIAMDSKTISVGGSETLNVTYDAPEEGETVKLFVWDDNSSPIIKAVDIAVGSEETEAPTEKPSGSLYTGTPGWTAVSGSAGTRANVLYSDQSQTKEAAVHIQGGGSGDRYAYTTFLPDGATADSGHYLIVDFYLNIAGSNTNTSHFYMMGAESKAAPTSGVIMDLAYDSYLKAISVNGTSIDNLPVSDQNSDLRPTDEAKYNVTGLIHYTAQIDFALKKVKLTIEGTSTKSYEVDFVDSSASQFVGFASLQGRSLSGLGIADVNVYLEDRGEVVVTHTVTYVMSDRQETETVENGSTVVKIPETELTSYIFKGWAKDNDMDNLLTTEQVQAMEITADTTFTAVYEKDESYIEPLTTVEFSSFPENGYPTAGADANTAADNIISVKLTGELGTDLGENPDSRVTDMDVEWTFDGFRTIASDGGRPTSDDPSSNIYCDSYAELKDVSATSVNFALKGVPFNFYGRVTAKVTYNGVTKTISKPMTILGNTTGHDSNVLLPRAGYVSDFDLYEDTMAGYVATESADNRTAADIVTDNWAAYGGNIKTLTITNEDDKKFMRLEALGTNSSCFASNIVDIPSGQVIISQDIRFYNAGSSILYKSTYPTNWPAGTATTMSVDFNGTAISLNGGEAIASATTGVWYTIVMSADVTSGLCYAIVYDEDGQELGRSDTVPFADAGSLTPQYLCYRTPDKATGKLDFNNVTVYVPQINSDAFDLVSTDTTLTIPETGEDPVTTTLSASAKSTEDYAMIGKAEWTIMDDTVTGVEIAPDAANSQNATLIVTSEASAGEVPIRVSIGGAVKDITVTLTSSKDSVRFSKMTSSISIPLTTGESDEYIYAADVINGDGEVISGKEITYAMYDRNNMYETTVEGVTFDPETATLTVTSEAKAATVYIRATSTNTNDETISKSVKVVIHGLAFDFGADTEDALVEGYTAVTDSTVYSDSLGYGITGTAELGGEASIDNADSDYLTGTFEFKVKVDPAKVYSVTINYSGNVASEYVNSDLSGVALSHETKSAETYIIPVIDDVLDLSFSNSAVVSSIVIEKQDDKAPGTKPNVFTVGDSTAANNGSWAYVLARDFANYDELAQLVTFSNNGRGGKNLSSYYTGGELRDRVLSQIRPGDYVMIGDMGTNGMGSYFEDDFNYYIDACIAMGAKVILNSYSPHGPMGGFESGYNSETNVFESYRKDAYDEIVRNIYAERNDGETIIGFVDIGKNADASFNAYVDDYAANDYASRADAANAIIDCFGDHNHYSDGPLACQLMIEGYNGTAGIVSCLYDIISADMSSN